MFSGLSRKIAKYTESVAVLKSTVFIAVLFIVQAVLGYFVIHTVLLGAIEASIRDVNQRAQSSIEFHNGTWDISRYNADPEIPGPAHLYIFANDGFVIDRWRPVPGYMNVSDARHLLGYQEPQTITTVTGQIWRVYSTPVMKDEATLGVVAVFYFNPTDSDIDTIDSQLRTTAESLLAQLRFSQEEIDVSQVSQVAGPNGISYQIVNQYNRILSKSSDMNSVGGTPDFIEATYVQRALQRDSQVRHITDDDKQTYLSITEALVDSNGTTRGVVIAFRSIDSVLFLKRIFLITQVALGIIALILWWFVGRRLWSQPRATEAPQLDTNSLPGIIFSKSECSIAVGDQKITFAYASNQYYMCQALFSDLKRKWETDELIERFGEELDRNSWRKTYDAAAAINKKFSNLVPARLIVTNNKTYSVNPTIVNKIQLDK